MLGKPGPRLRGFPSHRLGPGHSWKRDALSPGRRLTGWKTGGCRMKASGSGSSFSPGDMGVRRLRLEQLILIPGALPTGLLAFPSEGPKGLGQRFQPA